MKQTFWFFYVIIYVLARSIVVGTRINKVSKIVLWGSKRKEKLKSTTK